jgi:hypothetical protein
MATVEYVGAKRRAYAEAPSAKRTRLLDEVCETTGYSRKYANRLLTGSRKFRERKGRGKTYRGEVLEVLEKVWREAGCPCLPYFKAEVERWVAEYSAEVARVPPDVGEALVRMSASTMSRALAGAERVKPGWSKANKHSGRRAANALKEMVPSASGETVMACGVPPGDVQVDTFALGGGDSGGNFFWILDATDRKTQWTVLAPTWNRGQHATLEALRHIRRKFPFEMGALHADNGGEILNHHVAAWLGERERPPFLWRSRPRKSNDNAHVEEKNRSSGRQLFGEMRLDRPDLREELEKLCDDWSDFRNFFCPCKMLLAKEKRADGKGFRCRYDAPKTPFQRLLDESILTPDQETALREYRNRLSGMELYRRVRKRLKKIRRLQQEYNAEKRTFARGAPACPALPLRGTPPGTAVQRRTTPRLPPPTPAQDKARSVQYLTNQNPPPFLKSVLSI